MVERDGGPAFPAHAFDTPLDGTGSPGMTLRDYFAAAALTGLLANRTYLDCSEAYAWSLPVDDAYSVADAMLAERDK